MNFWPFGVYRYVNTSMKTLKTLLFIFLSISFFAQKPEKIYRLTRIERDHAFYTEQSALWKKEVERSPKSAAAWQNYYYAVRYANITDPTGSSEARRNQMKEIIAAMDKKIPGTLEYYQCKLLSFNKEEVPAPAAQLALMDKAYKFAPNDPDILEEMIVYAEVTGEVEKLREYNSHMLTSGIYELPVLEANYNMLMSTDKNSILFTQGDNETFPAWMLQQAKGVRSDVTVINTSLAGYFTEYLRRMLKQKNIVLPEEFYGKMKAMDATTFLKQLVLEINKKYPNVNIFFAVTYPGIYDIFTDSLYCTGLAYMYSPVRIENISKLKDNVENKFHLDYLKDGLVEIKPVSKQLSENFNYNYFIPFGMLYKYYRNLNESNSKMQFYKDFCLGNAAKRGKQEQMKEYLDAK